MVSAYSFQFRVTFFLVRLFLCCLFCGRVCAFPLAFHAWRLYFSCSRFRTFPSIQFQFLLVMLSVHCVNTMEYFQLVLSSTRNEPNGPTITDQDIIFVNNIYFFISLLLRQFLSSAWKECAQRAKTDIKRYEIIAGKVVNTHHNRTCWREKVFI